MSSVITFLDKYTSHLQHTADMVNEMAFKWCLKNPVDMTIINQTEIRIKQDQQIFDKICKALNEQEGAEQDVEDKTCCVCYEHEADQQLNCVHKLCLNCYGKLTKCPMCRVEFKEDIVENDEDDDTQLVQPRVGYMNSEAEMWIDGATTYVRVANPSDIYNLSQVAGLRRTDICLSEDRNIIFKVDNTQTVHTYFENKGNPLGEVVIEPYHRNVQGHGVLTRDSWQPLRYQFNFFSRYDDYSRMHAELLRYLKRHNVSVGTSDDRRYDVEGIADHNAVLDFFEQYVEEDDDEAIKCQVNEAIKNNQFHYTYNANSFIRLSEVRDHLEGRGLTEQKWFNCLSKTPQTRSQGCNTRLAYILH